MPTEEQTYRIGMIEKLEGIERQIGTIDKKVDAVDAKVTYTNGKVKKIIVVLVLLAGVIIGQGTTNFNEVARFFIGIIT